MEALANAAEDDFPDDGAIEIDSNNEYVSQNKIGRVHIHPAGTATDGKVDGERNGLYLSFGREYKKSVPHIYLYVVQLACVKFPVQTARY